MKKEYLVIVCIGVILLFFYKLFLGYIPFPGDLLITEYNPWKTYSFLGYNPGTFPSKLQYFDTVRQLYPWKTFSLSELRNGIVPLWNPYNFSGSPLFANVQSAVLYPFNILYFLFPQIIAWSLLVVFQPLIAAVGTYFFARFLGLQKTSSLLAGISYSCSLFMTVFIEYNTIGHVMAFLPVTLFAAESILKRITPWNFSLFVLSIVFAFFAGHIQIFVFSELFIFSYILFRILTLKSVKKKIFLAASFFLGGAVGIGICAVQILPTLELISVSARSLQEYNFLIHTLLIQPYQLVLLISPDIFGNPVNRNYLISDTYPGNALYIGLIPIAFACVAALSFKKNNVMRFFLFTCFALLLFFVRTPFSEFFYSLRIPFFSTGSPTNGIFILSFSFSILAGYGLNLFLQEQKYTKLFVLLTSGLIILGIYYVGFRSITNTKNIFLTSGIIIIFFSLVVLFKIAKRMRRFFMFAIIFVTILDLFFFFQKFNPFVLGELVFPNNQMLEFLQKKAGVNRFWGYGSAAIEANFATQYKLFSPDGYDPLYPRWYGEFIQSSKEGKLAREFNNTTRSDAVVNPGGGERDLMTNPYRLRVLDVLGVKYILDKKGSGTSENTFPATRFKQAYEDDVWRIYENLDAAPRAFLTSEYKTYSDKEEFEKIFFSKDFNPSKTLLFKKGSVSGMSSAQYGNATLKLVSYSPDAIKLQTSTDASEFLFISDTFYPGWKAWVDSRPATIQQAHYAFRAVSVPAGSHQVVLRYEPDSFSTGWKISIISGILLVVLAFGAKRIKNVT